jgi:NAD(P)-dependent dehydrogenase (short-subunit alcohol dehydrogenase family)
VALLQNENKRMRAVLVTGVSTGIGFATAKVLIERGFRVYGSVRKEADAERVKGELGENFKPLLFDVTDEDAIQRAAALIRDDLGGATLAGLVNNAGIAVTGPLTELATTDYRQQLEVNLVGPFMVTKAFAPQLGADTDLTGDPGRVVNISSAAGLRAMPFLGPYSASKFGLEGYSEALRRELMLFGIDVVIIGPGPVKSAIWDKAEDVDLAPYADSPFLKPMERFRKMFLAQGRDGYPSERLGNLVHYALTTPKPKPRYAAVKEPLLQKIVTRLAPMRTLDRMIAKMLGLKNER